MAPLPYPVFTHRVGRFSFRLIHLHCLFLPFQLLVNRFVNPPLNGCSPHRGRDHHLLVSLFVYRRAFVLFGHVGNCTVLQGVTQYLKHARLLRLRLHTLDKQRQGHISTIYPPPCQVYVFLADVKA